MRALDRKFLRNLWSLKGQLTAIMLIVACGVASFVTVFTAYRGLKTSKDTYYRRYRMADLFAPVKRAPRSVLRDLEAVEGVRRVEGRIVFDVTLDLPRLASPASGRVISVPDRRRAILCDLHLTAGGWFEGDGTRQVVVSERFAKVHGLEVGDAVSVLMNNKKEALRIVGTALSPEFVYLIRGAGDVLPDPEHFTVLWVTETFAEAVFAYEDACNDVLATLDRDVRTDDVIAIFDDRLDRHGAFGAYALEDQLSNRYLSDEIKGLEGSGTMVPTIFLGVAAFVLYILVGRLVRTQRTQIALFRAFGYTTRDLVWHYLKPALAVGLAGGAVGSLMGMVFARLTMQAYQTFFYFPLLDVGADPGVVGAGFAVSIGFAVLGAFGAVRAVLELNPAEGLRPEAPRVYRRTWVERITPLWRFLGFVPRMVVRHVMRTKVRAAVTAAGVGFAASILVLSFYGGDAMDHLMDAEFRLVQRQDATVTFYEEQSRSALYEMQRLEGVRQAEPELALGVRLVNGPRSRRTAILGLERGQTLRGLMDRDLAPVSLPRDGLLLSRKLADLLGVAVGDLLEARMLTGDKRRFRVPVENVVDEYLGVFAYAELGTLSKWVGEEGVLTGVRLTVDPAHADDLGRELKSLPAVAAVNFKQRTLKAFQETIAGTQEVSYAILILFAGVITFGVTYNAARISLSERARELGSLRVLGLSTREVGRVLVGENLLVTTLGLLPGLGLGLFFCWVLSSVYETDLYRFPFVVNPDSLLWTVVTVLAFSVLANVAVRARLKRADIVEVLKERE
jgi:putative ABC transport system permease protein